MLTWKRRPDAEKPGPKLSDARLQAMCDECGNVRTHRRSTFGSLGGYDRMLRCVVCGCGQSTPRYGTDLEGDYGERQNAKANGQARRASEPYDPELDALRRHPDWNIQPTVTIRGELIDFQLKLIKINPGARRSGAGRRAS